MDWCTIESDPGVFTELIQAFGTKGVQVEELYGLSEEDFARLRPVYGLIFLFKWQHERDSRPIAEHSPDVFFADQVVSNACATQALLAILLNTPGIELGDELTNFKSFTADFPSDLKGMAISNSPVIRTAHNSFARPEPFVAESRAATKDDDVFHFISYVAIKGKVYELDGLKKGAICLGDVEEGQDWLTAVHPHITERIQKYSASEIRFSLMALIRDRRDVQSDRLTKLAAREERLRAALAGGEGAMGGGEEEGAAAASSGPAAEDDDAAFDALVAAGALPAMQTQLDATLATAEQCRVDLETTKAKFAMWKDENVRRKHNYVPFAVAFLKQLAKKRMLEGLVRKAEQKRLDRDAAKKAKR